MMNEGVKTCGRPSRGRYQAGCRCFMCRQANAQYEYERSHGMHGERALVGERETAEARERVEKWQRKGIGLRTVELWTGVHRSSLQTLVSGNHVNCNGKPRRVSRESYEAIMQADPRPAPNTPVDASRALDAMRKMRDAGMSYGRISELSGVPLSTVHSLAYRPRGKCAYKTSEGLCRAWRERNRKGKRHAALEDWQWREMRVDFARGVEASVLAERYGVSKDAVRAHMRERGVSFAQSAAYPVSGSRAG